MAPPATSEYRVDTGQVRLDQFLARKHSSMTRAQLQRLISDGHVRLNGSPARPSQKVKVGDLVSLVIPPPRPVALVPQALPLNLVYQDSDIVVLDKPAGIPVHPGPGHPDKTIVNGLLALCPDIQGIGGDIRPGIVHRLDKDTSGLMMVAKTHAAHQSLSQQIKSREVTKGYLALAVGQIEPRTGLIDLPIARDPRNRKRMAVVVGGREARTRYQVVKDPPGHSLVELLLETGRTHQIRVHLAYLGNPLLGDELYGRSHELLPRQFLHAHHLGFRHPASGDAMEFHSALPPDLEGALELLTTPGQSHLKSGETSLDL